MKRSRAAASVPEVAREMAREAAARGARSALLLGSHARGEAHEDSDVDLYLIGDGPAYSLERRGGHLVSLSWRTAAGIASAMRTPEAAMLVPALRDAVVLHDPRGIARRLKARAAAWSWERIGVACDRWVAAEITGLAEEVHRLVGSVRRGNSLAAAAMRSVLALRLAGILAVHLRLLCDTENRLWDLVSRRMGTRWRRAQESALGIGGEGLAGSCDAALELYALAVRRTRGCLDPRELAVVNAACRAGRRKP